MKILLLQERQILENQRELIFDLLADLEDAEVGVASSVEEAERHSDASVLITPTNSWFPNVLAQMDGIEWVHFLSSGVDRIWPMDFDKDSYMMSNSAGVHAIAISEYVIGAVLYITKGFGQFAAQQSRREWARFWLDECVQKTIGIIGVGAIGSRVAKLAKELGMRVIGAVRSSRELPNVDQTYGLDGINQVLSRSDFVVLLVPLTEETQAMIGASQIDQMRAESWLINAARGEVIDEAALVDALQRGRIAGAVLDVFKTEPLPESSPLWDMPNVLITPHVAGTTDRYMHRALDIFKDNYRAYTGNKTLVTPVSPTKGY